MNIPAKETTPATADKSATPQVPGYVLRRPTVPPTYYTANGGWNEKINAAHEFASVAAALKVANQISLTGVEIIGSPSLLTESGAAP